MGVFIDLKKAFDTIDHNILIDKLERYGIRGFGLSWVRSFPRKRKQFVQIGEYKSSYMDITCGVQQGLVLGPKLFNFHINDIRRVSELLKFYLQMIQTFFCSGDDLQRPLKVITMEINKLKQQFENSKLSLNLSQTKVMLLLCGGMG